MYLYNIPAKKKEKFRPLQKVVRVYICGPTVYSYVHIGNLSSFLSADLLIRYLKFSGYNIKSVMNITDIEDKIIKVLKEKNELHLDGLNKLTQFFINKFFKDLKALEIKNIDFFPKATEYIPEIIKAIKILIKKDLAYFSSDNSVYYNIKNFKNYGKLSNICNIKKELLRSRQKKCKKQCLVDFVLWRAWKKEDGDIYWDSPWGKGRPGWHIECSVMSIKNLGESFDIHAGAVDLIFPHHENEIAQSEGITGKKFVNYWMHREHLMINGQKMSKSLGNFYILSDILQKIPDPLSFRYLILTNHYRLNLNFTFEALKSASNSLKKIHNFIDRLGFIKKQNDPKVNIKLLIDKNRRKFKELMDDDLNVSSSIASLFDFISNINTLLDKDLIDKNQSLEILDYLREIDTVWGFIFIKNLDKNIELEEKKEIKELIQLRNNYRDKKEWLKADKIRDKIGEMGFILVDNNNQTNYKKIRKDAGAA